MRKLDTRGRPFGHARNPVRHSGRLGGAVVGGVVSGMLTALMAANATAAQPADAATPKHLSKAIAAIEKGDGGAAIRDLETLAETGDAEAGYLLGSIWHKGLGVRRDFAKAREAYASAAFLGHPKAMNELGLLYRDGLGVVADPVEAVAWFRVASEFNLSAAMENRDRLEAELMDRDRAAGRALALRRELEIDLLSRDKLGAPPALPTRTARDASTRHLALAMLRQDADDIDGDTDAAEPVRPMAKVEPVPVPEAEPGTGLSDERPFLVQIGVFAKAESIRRIRAEAEQLGMSVQETAREVDGRTATRLTAGPFRSEDAAREAAAKLNAALKVTTRVVPAAS